ncbi:MAG: helix-turn-helix domain-containing protein [Desulfomonilaceae bacterium]
MTKRAEAFINHELLLWARRTAGLNLSQAARKVGVPEDRLASWERGQNRPTINQLRKLASAYKRPIAVFYLPAPPRDFQPLRDYRRLVGAAGEPASPGLLWEVRRARAKREIAIDLYRSLDEKPPRFLVTASVKDDPEALARRIRNEWRISPEIQTRFTDKYEAFNWWRNSLELKGILVFQANQVDISEMRGFSLSERPLPVIVTNVKDLPLARIFTMLHELVHVAIRQGGVCDLEEYDELGHAEQEIEVFRN